MIIYFKVIHLNDLQSIGLRFQTTFQLGINKPSKYADILVQLLAHGADIPFIRSVYSPAMKDIINKWSVFMGILALQGLSIPLLHTWMPAQSSIFTHIYLVGEEREKVIRLATVEDEH